jgi:hypothetical protein
MAAWLGVVSAEHVARGVSLGIAQINHGKRAGLARMRPGDWLVYYSPQQRLGGHQPVKAFTAIGQLPDGEVWQADEGCFKPWRRRVDYRAGVDQVPIETLRGRLQLTAAPNWGYQLRRGLIPLSDNDFSMIHEAMTRSDAPPAPPAPQTPVGNTATLW